MTALENLAFYGRIYGLSNAEVKPRAEMICNRLGLSGEHQRQMVKVLSRGQQQKIAVARAFLTSPVLMLLDEPTTGLDPRSKLDVQAFIEEVNATHDATIVLTTHDLAEAERLCGRITVLNEGRVVAEDTPDGLKATTAGRLGRPATLEDVFMTYTGRSLDDDIDEDDAEPDGD